MLQKSEGGERETESWDIITFAQNTNIYYNAGIVGGCSYRQDLTLVKRLVLLLRNYGVQKKGILNPVIMTYN